MVRNIDAAAFQRMVIHGAASINAQKQPINDLNVFPVPDGDTGTNMSLTIGAAAAEMKKKRYDTVGQAAQGTASALLRGARGNSGVILSLLFRGFAKAIKEKESMDGRDLAIALDFGVAAAYKAVMKPAEGTILTVSRLAAARAAGAAREDDNLEAVLEAAIQEGQTALANTINQNPVLKKAGVVDAGGKGFLVILQGMLDELRGEPMPESGEETEQAKEKAEFSEMADEEITFAFDTVFIVRKNAPEVNLDPFRAYLNSIGDSLVIGEDDEAFKVHVHTNTPGDALNESQKYGTLELAKIENMRTQRDDLAAGRKAQSTDDLEAVEAELEAGTPSAPVKAAPEKKFGYVAVCAGEGLEAVFRDLGVDGLVGGGQTMNPSTEDILKEIDATPAEIVYVLPNNKNIIMAAQQCVPLCEDKKVVVLQTKTVPQGISAMLAADPDASEEDNTSAMTEAFSRVRTSEITYAARDSDFGGFAIKQGDYLALEEHQLFGTDQDLEALLDRLAHAQSHQDAEFISLFYGEDVTEEQAQKAEAIFAAACPNAEVSLLPGGQPVYYYMISAE
ncbi:DAK2 domain-containing protein [Pseudoflavonifractor phocaeensis]|uniref:DAK2 domain-containing protein n=1 Tax=Pseudoflavonifractor phocaeensis TaxID=1870988 RepID=UPI001F38B8C9|nr:DAK2 domain-containing protein [Pseudoflavonifractor phocaeensis]MCF2595757.1 DAK2 domain-containing protein [Pseudoflavonifractor phocaeensis]